MTKKQIKQYAKEHKCSIREAQRQLGVEATGNANVDVDPNITTFEDIKNHLKANSAFYSSNGVGEVTGDEVEATFTLNDDVSTSRCKLLEVYENNSKGFKGLMQDGFGKCILTITQNGDGKYTYDLDQDKESIKDIPKFMRPIYKSASEWNRNRIISDVEYLVYDYEYMIGAFNIGAGIRCDAIRNQLESAYPQYTQEVA